jgi:hypothetical protein
MTNEREKIEAMRTAGLISQEDYNEMISGLNILNAGQSDTASFVSPTPEGRELVEKYTQWKKSVDQHLLTVVGYNLAQSKLMVPSLENTTGDMYRAGDSPEDASLIVISTIEDNQ